MGVKDVSHMEQRLDHHLSAHRAGCRHGATSPPRATDPVCGMDVDPATARHRAEHDGRTYYFCSAGCRAKFAADPAKYLGPGPAPEAAPAGAIYTSPMHPEIRQAGPGACPICGMALEPMMASADSGPN